MGRSGGEGAQVRGGLGGEGPKYGEVQNRFSNFAKKRDFYHKLVTFLLITGSNTHIATKSLLKTQQNGQKKRLKLRFGGPSTGRSRGGKYGEV